ncbi:Uncharacterized membrane protein YcaP, DUF421 family [Cnuella takakiae]|uniref:Uncharacterized membrane protein YcaP, DUF421 family n=1 Tax=Cnuella takakiae TaxID=1302690 RepID=A0A1M5ITE3_9BACT|nr:DUF421 domain-containing protein [Cnuella takakiae]OLY93984.1 hypothetical protein BUE76_20435 [Cnuella takakiae]SHG31577.1 Uncharacterized membrane protein YcaP, DUF421 family [Cnuella takakiae]
MKWDELLLGGESWSFLAETVLRTTIMFTVIVVSLRLLGKRGIKQLSVFELGVIIGLGSAAGDPMFYKDVGLLPSILVFTIVISLYRFVTYLISRSRRFESLVEGNPTCIIKDGEFIVENFRKEPIAFDELFTQLRLHSIAHLGQVEQAVLENNGEVSVYYVDEKDLRYGLPILPDMEEFTSGSLPQDGMYACTFCGRAQELKAAQKHNCGRCGKDQWKKASKRRRNT